MSHDYNKDFDALNEIYFDLKGATPVDGPPGINLQNEKMEPMPEIPMGIELSVLNVFLTSNTSTVVSDKHEKENFIIAPAGPDPLRQTFRINPDLDTQGHEPFLIILDRPGRTPKYMLTWKYMNKKLLVRW